MTRNGVYLLLNLSFIAFFYLCINAGWINIALPLIWLFVPATLTIGLFFYRFNTLWLKDKNRLDNLINWLPLLILSATICLEIIFFFYPESLLIKRSRVILTESTMRYLFPLFNLLLILLNLRKLKSAEKRNRELFASHHLVNLNWSRNALLFYVVFVLTVILSELVSSSLSEVLFNLSILILTLYIGYYQIRVIARYLKDTSIKKTEENNSKTPESKSASSDTITEEEKLLFNRIETVIDQDQLFLNENLTVHDIANKLEVNSKNISRAINAHDELNFNKFINQKRVDFARKLLVDPKYDHFTIEGIARESGFRSKSTFNTTFKSIIGLTPSAYKKRDLKNEAP
jgi:AraC-like DNA-binding protein/positive regulator of sigma E activity